MAAVAPEALDEPTRVAWWLHERMAEACAGDDLLAAELVCAGADYRRVHNARINGANLDQLRRIFGDPLETAAAAS